MALPDSKARAERLARKTVGMTGCVICEDRGKVPMSGADWFSGQKPCPAACYLDDSVIREDQARGAE